MIRHTIYEKEISAPLLFHTKASHSWRTKIVVLSEELRKRIRYWVLDIAWERR